MTIPIRERWILANWYHVDISLFVIGKLPNSSTFYVHIPKTSEDHVTTFKVIPSVSFKFNQREMCPKKPRSLEYILRICIVTTPCRQSTNTRQQPVHIQSAWPPWANWHGDLGEEIKRSKKAKNGWHKMDKKGRWRYPMIWKLKQDMAPRQSVHESEAAMAHKVVHPNAMSTSIQFCTDEIHVRTMKSLSTWKRTCWSLSALSSEKAPLLHQLQLQAAKRPRFQTARLSSKCCLMTGVTVPCLATRDPYVVAARHENRSLYSGSDSQENAADLAELKGCCMLTGPRKVCAVGPWYPRVIGVKAIFCIFSIRHHQTLGDTSPFCHPLYIGPSRHFTSLENLEHHDA